MLEKTLYHEIGPLLIVNDYEDLTDYESRIAYGCTILYDAFFEASPIPYRYGIMKITPSSKYYDHTILLDKSGDINSVSIDITNPRLVDGLSDDEWYNIRLLINLAKEWMIKKYRYNKYYGGMHI